MTVQPTPRLNAADLAAFDAARESIVACPTNHRTASELRTLDAMGQPTTRIIINKFCPDCGVRLADTREGTDNE